MITLKAYGRHVLLFKRKLLAIILNVKDCQINSLNTTTGGCHGNKKKSP